jgi:hypothetical protein
VVAAEARPAVARGHSDRAEETQVVELEDHGRPAGAGRLERARAEEREHVVHVGHVGLELAGGGAHVVLVAPPAEQGKSGCRAGYLARAALQEGVRNRGAAHRVELELD